MNRKKLLLYLTVFVCGLLFFNITYTDDYAAYSYDYDKEDFGGGNDYGFIALMSLCRFLGLEFGSFYNVSIIISLFLIAYTLYRFKINVLFGMFFIIVINYVQIANQLRYFISFPLFLLSVDFLCVHRKKIAGLLLCILSFLFHNGVLGCLLFFPLLFFIERNKFNRKQILALYTIVGIIVLLLFSSMSSIFLKLDDKYETYTSADGATLLGLGYMLLFPIFNLLVSYNVQKGNDLSNKENLVLFSLSMFPVIYAIATLSGLQIVVARYVNVFFIVWVITAFKNIVSKNRIMILFAYLIIAVISKNGMSIYNYNSSIEDNEIVKIALIWQSKGK